MATKPLEYESVPNEIGIILQFRWKKIPASMTIRLHELSHQSPCLEILRSLYRLWGPADEICPVAVDSILATEHRVVDLPITVERRKSAAA